MSKPHVEHRDTSLWGARPHIRILPFLIRAYPSGFLVRRPNSASIVPIFGDVAYTFFG